MSERKKILFSGMVFFVSLSAAIIFCFVLFNWSGFKGIIAEFFSVLNPVIYGFVIAYVLIPVINVVEGRIFYPLVSRLSKRDAAFIKNKSGSLIRKASIVIVVLFAFLVIYGFFSILMPSLAESIGSIINQLPTYATNLNNWFTALSEQNTELSGMFWQYYDYYNVETTISNEVLPAVTSFLRNIPTEVIRRVSILAKGVGNVIVGFIISIYFMYGKERFLAQVKKVLFAFMSRERANTFISNLEFIHKTFIGFISGKIVDSFIIGILCYFLVIILKMPYPVLISVIIGVTNVIPYFGPFLGAIPCALLILMVNPMQCLYFIIMILLLQQFDGNILGPKILGDSTGLSGFWVIFAITIFGGIFGVGGLFIGVPVFAVIYAVMKTIVNTRLLEKQLPIENENYINLRLISDEGHLKVAEEDGKKTGKSWTLHKPSGAGRKDKKTEE